MLKEVFINLVSKYAKDPEYANILWEDILKKHSKKSRHYHNINHLEHLYYQLIAIKDQVKDWDMILFALFYHDYIYNVLKDDNEVQSAKKAKEILKSLSIPESRVDLCSTIILATKGHQISANNDVNYFTDADLAILGSTQKDYIRYFKNVRKEYKYYPDFMYTKGRIKVLKHFIDMPRIFKTHHFHNLFEKQAKENLMQELNLLSN
ncbi:hypothetical protein [Aquimarina sp. MMG016]|uniref:HD domain-containing protein n=1 Tax=Aquimarina sp. MMG016 TaxID=2822690 RepID=UPI001B3A74E0|nr:hypothetical protein [Aquimarina sp. MMG016]MBQ4818924.1 hypothetical protein [Aquimarina sp. MMG016]